MKEAIEIATPFIKSFEGLKLKRYKCPNRYETIGYGHVIQKSEKIPPCITEEEANTLLYRDIQTAAIHLNSLFSTGVLTVTQAAALISFIFNVGSGAFLASTLRQKLQRGEYESAANEFTKWCFACGTMLKGLLRRRLAEKDLFLKGTYDQS